MRDWKYGTQTEDAIRTALLELLARKQLADISVSELAREAHVSRSTFYEHFGNTSDVYDSVIERFSEGLSPMMDQVACTSEMKPSGMPLCARLREDGPFAPAIGEDRFLTAFLGKAENLETHDLYCVLTDAGYGPGQARALCTFQLAGCFTAARASREDGSDWLETKAAIDRFILGGVAACLAAKRSAALRLPGAMRAGLNAQPRAMGAQRSFARQSPSISPHWATLLCLALFMWFNRAGKTVLAAPRQPPSRSQNLSLADDFFHPHDRVQAAEFEVIGIRYRRHETERYRILIISQQVGCRP